MRAVKTVISAAGNLKRENPDMEEVESYPYFPIYHLGCLKFFHAYKRKHVFLGFTMQICSKSEWGSTCIDVYAVLERANDRKLQPTHTVTI